MTETVRLKLNWIDLLFEPVEFEPAEMASAGAE